MSAVTETLSPFQVHQLGCSKCKDVDFNETSSLQKSCLVGAPLLRDHLSEIATKDNRKVKRQLKKQFEVPTRATRQKLKEITRYVGDKNFGQLF